MKNPRITIVGDILVKPLAEMHISHQVQELFDQSSLVVGNLEGSETRSVNQIEKAGPHLKQNIGTISLLKKAGFSCFGLANNHIMDYGRKGLLETLKRCEEKGIKTCGAGETMKEALSPARFDISGKKISIFSFAEKEFGFLVENVKGTGYLPVDCALIEQSIEKEKKLKRFIIILVHGGAEECPFPTNYSRKRYRELVTSGADLVVGSHPHVAQGYETYKGKQIYYSLGDFTVGFSSSSSNKWGLVLQLVIEQNGSYTCNLIPVINKDGSISVLENVYSRKCLQLLKTISHYQLNKDLFQQFYNLQISYLFNTRYVHFLNQLFFKSPPLLWYLKFNFRPYRNSDKMRLNLIRQLLMQLMFTNESHREIISEGLRIRSATETNLTHKSEYDRLLFGVNDFTKA